jgi:hypothetical protein
VNGGRVQIWSCNGLSNQQWIFDESSGEMVYGGNTGNPALCLDSGNMQQGSQLKIWECNGLPQQKFGYDVHMFTLYMPASVSDASTCLDLLGGDFSQGASIQVWSCTSCWNQQWIFGGGVGAGAVLALDNLSINSSGKAVGLDLPENNCPPIPGPPGPPAPPGACVGGWPKFNTQADLQADLGWAKYFQAVYGQVPSDPSFYPLCLGDLWMFHTNTMQDSGVTGVPPLHGPCPGNNAKIPGRYYGHMSGLQPPNVAWSWHPLPHVAFPSNTWVEVIHRKFVKDEHSGAWFFYARGLYSAIGASRGSDE